MLWMHFLHPRTTRLRLTRDRAGCRSYVDYLLGALSRRELFCWLSLSPSKFWHTLLLRDRWGPASCCIATEYRHNISCPTPRPHSSLAPSPAHAGPRSAPQVQLPGRGGRGATRAAHSPGLSSRTPIQRGGGLPHPGKGGRAVASRAAHGVCGQRHRA